MLKDVNKFFPISLLFFVVIEIFLVKMGQFQVGIFMYIAYALILYLIDSRYIISLFVYYLPLLPIIPTDYKVFGIVGPHEIVYGFSLFVLYTMYNKGKSKRMKLNKEQKLSIAFVFILFFMLGYPLIKDILLGLNLDKKKQLMYIVKNMVRFYLYFTSLILLIKVIYQKGLYDYVLVGIKYAVATITISMIFTRELLIMGAGVSVEKHRIPLILAGVYKRYVGFYGAGGDENSVGIFMASAFGFFLALFEKNGDIKKYVVFMGFAVLGVLLTGSRTSFMALASVILIFMITNKSGKTKMAIFGAIVIFYFAFSKQLNMVVQRFFDPSAAETFDPHQVGRIFKWILYTNWLIKNPDTLLLGNIRNINFYDNPHNYFLFIIYHAGIIPLIIFFKLLFKLFNGIRFVFKSYTLKNVYYILPFPFIIMTVNSIGSSIYLWIYLPIGAYYLSDKIKKQNLT